MALTESYSVFGAECPTSLASKMPQKNQVEKRVIGRVRQERNWGHSPERLLLLLNTRCAVSNMTGSQSSTFIFCEISVICFG